VTRAHRARTGWSKNYFLVIKSQMKILVTCFLAKHICLYFFTSLFIRFVQFCIYRVVAHKIKNVNIFLFNNTVRQIFISILSKISGIFIKGEKIYLFKYWRFPNLWSLFNCVLTIIYIFQSFTISQTLIFNFMGVFFDHPVSWTLPPMKMYITHICILILTFLYV